MNSMLAPICLFTYNRLSETQQTVEALKANYLALESELYIFSDGYQDEQNRTKVEKVRQYIRSISGFKSVHIRESKGNNGLADSIIEGVTQLLDQYEKVIVLEDDLISSANFLTFMNQTLNFYQHDQNIQSISGYALSLKGIKTETYFQHRPGSWGWATWKDRWNKDIFDKQQLKIKISSDPSILKKFRSKCGADMPRMLLDSINNRNDSWYARWIFDHFLNNRHAVFPARSFIRNIGYGKEGIHCQGINTSVSEPVDEKRLTTKFAEFQTPDARLVRQFLHYFTLQHKLLFRIKLLKKQQGRTLIMEEIKTRIRYR